MAQFKKVLAIILAVCMICAVGIVAASAANVEKEEEEPVAAGGITVHYYCPNGTPTVYWWNSLPTNITMSSYPGKAMISEGGNYYKYTFSHVTKINMLFIANGGTRTINGIITIPSR